MLIIVASDEKVNTNSKRSVRERENRLLDDPSRFSIPSSAAMSVKHQRIGGKQFNRWFQIR